jgi:tRNA (guanine10-N2)-methyltransferase
MINFLQYNLTMPEIFRMDTSRNAYLHREFFDAIVCDPPYGIRATTRKSGKKAHQK